MGETFACFQSAGTLPSLSDLQKILVRGSATVSASSLRTLGLMLSGPDAFPGFNFFRSFSTPGAVMLMAWRCRDVYRRESRMTFLRRSGLEISFTFENRLELVIGESQPSFWSQ